MMETGDVKSVCVFCGSRPGAQPDYLAAAGALGRILAEKGLTLVYGGASVGTMGALADAALAAGGKVIGVIPERLRDRELAHGGLTELHVVSSMHERKAKMEKLSDAVIAMPGGFGTFEELFEIITWGQLGLHSKPIGILNAMGYFDSLRHQLHRGVSDGFIPVQHADQLLFEADPALLVDTILAYRPPPIEEQVITRRQT